MNAPARCGVVLLSFAAACTAASGRPPAVPDARPTPGNPFPLGAMPDPAGVNFCVELALFERDDDG